MRKIILLAITLIAISSASAQDFSNKGKEFWLCFPNHIPSGPNGQMNIWITSDQASSGVVSISNGTFTVPFNVTANGIVPINIPHSLAHISNAESGMVIQKSIKITVDPGQPAVVAYVQQFGNARSAATLLLPTNVLGKKYRAVSFTHTNTSAGGQSSRSHFQIIATQPNTQVEVTPFANGVSGTPFTINFTNAGDMYQYQATSDVTGTLIESLATGPNGCLPIAVFSGNSAVTIGTPSCSGNSYDPLFQQCYPVSTWGKNFGFIPFGDYPVGNPYRVLASEDNTTVSFNGVVVATLNAGQIYPAAFTSNPVLLSQPTSITADKPICVSQYMQTSACSGSNNGDPDMVILNPIEQNIKDITVFTSTQQNINRQWINVLIQTTAAASFRIDGFAPSTPFQTHPNLPGYSYLQHRFIPFNSGSRLLTADSGFNAILYGNQQGNFESYAYSAGTNVRDLTQVLEIETTYGIEISPSVCTNSPFKFKFYVPDSTLGTPPVAIRFDSLRWNLSDPALIIPNNFPIIDIPAIIDSTNIRNGRQVNWYSLPTTYYFNTAGVDTLLVTGYTSTNEGCGSNREYAFPIQISDPPTASFTIVTPGCYTDPVVVTETTPQTPKATYRHWWEFFDPVTNLTTVFSGNGVRSATHTFTTPGTIAAGTAKRIRHASITTPGCLSDTIVQIIELPDVPNATIAGNTSPVCINAPVGPDVVFTGTPGTPEYIFTYTINGGAPIVSAPSVGGILTIQHPTTVANTFIYELVGVRNATPVGTTCTRNITGQTVTVTILPDHSIGLDAGNPNPSLCINTLMAPFTLQISDGATGIVMPPNNLPPGVTASLAGNIVTIAGTPTLAGSYPYSITTTGNACLTATFTGTITVDPDHSISLGTGDPNPIVCINNAIIPFTLTLADGATGIQPAVGLPAGVTATAVGNTITILGTPTVAGTFNYTITTTGNTCLTATFTGTIIVNPDHTIGLDAGNPNPTLCVNTLMTPFTLLIGDGATGIQMPPANLPPGVTASQAGNIITIAGTPTLAGTYNYTITTTGNTCLTDDFTGTIIVTGDATVVLSSATGTDAQELCRNSTIVPITYDYGGTATAAAVSGLPAGVTWSVAGNRVTIVGSPTVAGSFTYTVSTTGPCVIPSVTGTILVNQLPTAAFTFTAPSCETRTIQFTDASTPNSGALNSWTWNFGDPGSGPNNTSSLPNPTHTFATAGPYTVTLSVTTDRVPSCTSDPDASVVVTINYRPEAGFIVPEVCINDNATLFTDTSKIAVGGTINRAANQWNYGDGPPNAPSNNSVGQDGLHLYTATGIYWVTQIVTSNMGCTDTIRLPITINAADPVSSFSINNSGTLCSSDSVELVNLSTVSFGNVTRLEIYWDNVGAPGVFETVNVPVFNGITRHKYPTSATSRNYVIRMIAYSGNICFTQMISNITVHANPVVQLNNFPDACLLVAPYLLTQGSEIGGVPGTFAYSGPGITNPNGTFAPQVAGIGVHPIKYTFTASNPGGCIDTLTKFIIVRDTAHADFTFVTPSCEQVPTMFTDISIAAPTVTQNTVWDFGDGSPPEIRGPLTTFGHIFPAPGNYTVTMYNVSDYGCNSTVRTQTVTIDPNHSISLAAGSGSPTQTVCINNSIVPISYTLGGGATNVSIPLLPAGLAYNVVGTTLTITGAPTSTVGSPFSFTVQTTGNTCLVATANIVITVDPDHTISFRSGDTMQSVCINTAIDPIEYDLGGGANGVTISGLPTGVIYNVVGNILTISGTPTSIPATPGYTITTTGNTCLTASRIGEIQVHPYPVPAFTFDKGSYCIPNALVGFINNTTPAPLSNHTYSWDFGDAGSSTAISPSHQYTTEGPFNVILKARSTVLLNNGIIGCESVQQNLLNIIHPQPKADFVFNKPAVCIGDNVTITDNTDGKDGIVNQWFWDLGDNTTRVTNPVTHTYGDTIIYNITLYTVNSHGCNSDTITKPFSVNAYPHVNAGPDRFVLEGGSIQLETITFANNAQYLWTPNLYLSDSRVARPRVNDPKTDMTYRLTVTGRGGCSLSDDVFVKLLKFPVIPNTFTPNNDGINDTWKIDFLNTYPNNRVQIFTRAGNLVFQSRGYDSPWDGTLKGKPLPFDTYYYIIEPGNGRDPVTGYVTIIK